MHEIFVASDETLLSWFYKLGRSVKFIFCNKQIYVFDLCFKIEINRISLKEKMIQSQFEEYDANEGNHGNEGNEDVTGDL